MPGWLWIVNSVLYCKNPEQCPSGARIHFPKEWNQAQRLSFWWAHAPIRHENGFDSTWICNHNTLTSHIENKKYDEKSRTSRTSKVCKMLLMLFYHWHLNMEFTLIRVSHCHNMRPSFSFCLTIYQSLVFTLSCSLSYFSFDVYCINQNCWFMFYCIINIIQIYNGTNSKRI